MIVKHLELFRLLAARSPKATGGFVSDMWCRPMQCLYDLDTTCLSVEQREEVIETRVVHKRELRLLYQWLCHRVETQADGAYAASLHCVEEVLADFARSDDIDAKRFILDVTGWGEHGLAVMQENVL